MEYMVFQKELERLSRDWIPTFHDISAEIREIVAASGIKNGSCCVASHHTTCSVMVQEASHDIDGFDLEYLQHDLLDVMRKLIPDYAKEHQYRHPGPIHAQFGRYMNEPGNYTSMNTDGHLRSCFIGWSETLTVKRIAFNGGMFGGQAVAEVLFGTLNPIGRLPISIPRHSGKVPVYYNHLPGWHGGIYADLPAAPAFAFGEGGGYARFVYQHLCLNPEALFVNVDVTNTGAISAVETMQVYVHDCVASVMRPVKQLVAFQRVELEAGETKTVSVAINPDELALVTPDEKRVIEPGEFNLMVGHSSKDEDLLCISLRYGC